MNDSKQSGSALTAETIRSALESLAEELAGKNVTGEICLFGGTVMVLAFSARVSTKDVDALFQPATLVRELARRVGEEHGLPDHWLNDGVKGFLSNQHRVTAGNLPQFPNLRVTMPVPEYMLAMKCMASRLGSTEGDASDVPDIIYLIRHLKLTSPEAVLNIVGEYYPKERIPVKAQYLVEGLFAEGKI